ncbi:PadR family transcriptional regulator [Clostridioides difficile]|nr:PadR family transcriptional regulator [Clostridioides difficile]
MATIDLIVLGIVKQQPQSAYDIQKVVEYRNISRWVKISTPSIYKKVIQLEEKGYIQSTVVREGRMPEKAIYSLTELGEKHFLDLMFDTASKPVNIFLDFNAVIVNLYSLTPEKQKLCLSSIEENIQTLKSYIEENIKTKSNVPETGKAILDQQLVLAQTLETWVNSLKDIIEIDSKRGL